MTITPHAPPETEPSSTTVRSRGPRSDVVVALAQLAPRLGDVAWNLRRHQQVIAEACRDGADLVVFPELSLTGYFLKDLVPDVALRRDAEELRDLVDACRDIDVVCGFVLEEEDARFYNAACYISGGEVVQLHRKVYLPTYGLFDEGRYFSQGDRFRSFAAPLRSAGQRRPWHAGMLICEDLWHPTAPALLARQGVELFLCPSASPGRGILRGSSLGTARSYDAMTRTYAQLFTSYLIYVNRAGYEDGINFWGGSRVVGPDGRLLADPAGRSESLAYHRLDLATIRRLRIANPLLRDERHDVNDAETDRLRNRRTFD